MRSRSSWTSSTKCGSKVVARLRGRGMSIFLLSTMRPGRIVLTRQIDIPRPRSLATTFEPHFVDIVHELRDRISQEHA